MKTRPTRRDGAERKRKRWFRRSKSIGIAPGTMLAHEDSSESKIRVIRYSESLFDDQVIQSIDQLAALPGVTDTSSDGPVVWVNVEGLGSTHLLHQLADLFGMHPLAMEDVVNVHQRAKLEVYGDHLFFVIRMPEGVAPFDTEQVSLFLIGNVVLTLQERPGDCLHGLRERLVKEKGRIRGQGADYLLYAIIDTVIDQYFHELERYDGFLEDAADRLEKDSDQQLPIHLHDLRGDLLLFRKLMRQHHDAIESLLREPHALVKAETLYYFRDCQDHLNQLLESADTDRETCGELRELFFARLGQRNNDVMKVLTIIATIFIPMSFVAGVYGMNFDSMESPYNMPELDWFYGYPFAIGIMTLMAAGLVGYMARKGWLS